jgi:hypothetical protein
VGGKNGAGGTGRRVVMRDAKRLQSRNIG